MGGEREEGDTSMRERDIGAIYSKLHVWTSALSAIKLELRASGVTAV